MSDGISGEDVLRLRELLDRLSDERGGDEHLRLLAALEPFLDERRRKRLPECMEMVRFMKGRRADG